MTCLTIDQKDEGTSQKTQKKTKKCTHSKTETETETLKIVDKKNGSTIVFNCNWKRFMYHFDDFADKDKDLEIISLKKDPKHGRDASYFGQFFFC